MQAYEEADSDSEDFENNVLDADDQLDGDEQMESSEESKKSTKKQSSSSSSSSSSAPKKDFGSALSSILSQDVSTKSVSAFRS
jgi:hypothetical protein